MPVFQILKQLKLFLEREQFFFSENLVAGKVHHRRSELFLINIFMDELTSKLSAKYRSLLLN